MVASWITGLVFLLVSIWASAASPSGLFACLDNDNNLYGVTPKGKPGEGCAATDVPVTIGSVGEVTASNGLVGNLTNGVLDISLTPELAIPPSCPAGQVPTGDGDGGWICTLPGAANPNPASRVWIVPKWEWYSGGAADRAQIVNPGTERGTVRCYTMTLLGGYISDQTEEHQIAPGSRENCDAYLEGDARRVYGRSDVRWLVVVSDIAVLVNAGQSTFRNPNTGNIEAYPIDCRFPEGYETACDLAFD